MRGEKRWLLGERIANVLSPASAEAMALLKGPVLVEQLGCSPVTVESDCLELVQHRNGVTEVLSPYMAIMAECFGIAQRLDQVSLKG